MTVDTINRRIAAQSPLADILDGELAPSADCRTDAQIGDFVRRHCMTLYHPASTCRMGTDPMAVVEPANLSVRGLDGLRVADASVIPRMVSANIDAPTVMIAERAAGMTRPSLKVLFVTAYTESATARAEFLASGMDLLLKPFTLDGLGTKIRKMILR